MLTRDNKVSDSSVVITKNIHGNPVSKPNMDNLTGLTYTRRHNGVSEQKENSFAYKSEKMSKHEVEIQILEKIMKALGITMAMFGICHMDKIGGHKQSNGRRQRRSETMFMRVHSVYCWLVLTLFCGYLVRSVAAFFVGDSGSYTYRVIVGTWSLQVTLNVFIMMKASHSRFGHQDVACKTWETKVLPLMECLNVSLNIKKIKTIVTVIVIAGWTAVILNVSLIPVFLFKEDSNFSEAIATTLIAPLPVNFYTKVLVCVFGAFETVAWIVPTLYMVAVCFIVQSAFKVCSIALKNTVDEGRETNTYPKCLYKQRLLHLNISKCLELMDKDFHFLFANTFCTSIPLACFTLYHILKSDYDTMNVTVLAFWLVANIVFVTMATLAGATVNTEGHSPLDSIYDVGMNGITLEELGQLHLFTSKLNGKAIGFTVMTFVTVTKELFLTVGGLYLTYFVVLLQF